MGDALGLELWPFLGLMSNLIFLILRILKYMGVYEGTWKLFTVYEGIWKYMEVYKVYPDISNKILRKGEEGRRDFC